MQYLANYNRQIILSVIRNSAISRSNSSFAYVKRLATVAVGINAIATVAVDDCYPPTKTRYLLSFYCE